MADTRGRIEVRECLEYRRQAVVHHLAKRFYQALYKHQSVSQSERVDTAWIRIESLSQLRAQVGGRFQNLKQRWVAAGFPLREHRGDRSLSGSVKEAEWLELTTWIAKQGFEARLVLEADDAALLELRKIED